MDSVTVHYPHHPYYQLTLPVVRARKSGLVDVRAPDGTIRGLPIWMTQKHMCARIIPSPFPYCSVESLRELRTLLLSARKREDRAADKFMLEADVDCERINDE